jgi:ectoine hydroxylase-related dioxygenase (phytanoyl-CoA dioxygenase family)
MHLPFMSPFIDPAIVTNPLVLPIIDEILGQNCVCHYFASDTPLPGSDYQRVHSDIHPLFPDTPLSLPAYSLVLNIPLVEFHEENGPLEIWPGGSHFMPGGIDLQALAPLMRSERVLMPAGSLLLRDMRMWHRGTPNRGDAARPNIALIYSRHWLKTTYPPIGIPQTTYEELSERAKQLFRSENIGGPLVNVP